MGRGRPRTCAVPGLAHSWQETSWPERTQPLGVSLPTGGAASDTGALLRTGAEARAGGAAWATAGTQDTARPSPNVAATSSRFAPEGRSRFAPEGRSRFVPEG